MAEREHLLGSKQMALFVARGYLRLEGVVPDEINRAFMAEADANELPVVPAGTANLRLDRAETGSGKR